ncbi:hypothetical protein [Paraglaciecola sp.]|uniref:hypothetical protein n=1 Tax=Paraglaciecola sp. TaxID=1920173 RepID=UPI0030F37ADD
MQAFKQYQLHLTFVAVLLAIKFVILPLFDWQDQQLLEIQLLNNKINRIDNVLKNRNQILEHKSALELMLADNESVFFNSDSLATFQLEQQQWLENKIKKYELDVGNIGWSPQQTLAEFDLTAHFVQLNVDGRGNNIFRFIQELQADKHYVGVQAFNVNFKRQNKLNLGAARVRLNLVFYRQGAVGKI